MKLIVGLGNPGERYANTYHNMGFRAVTSLAEKLGKKIKDKDCGALTKIFSKNGEKIILALPETFMNLSGEAVGGLMKKYGASLGELIVVYDDIDIPCGNIRLRKSGSAGTHNGMRSIVKCLNACDFKRVRIGIGDKPDYMDIADYVLKNVDKDKSDKINNAIDKTSDMLIQYLDGTDFENLMQRYNVNNNG